MLSSIFKIDNSSSISKNLTYSLVLTIALTSIIIMIISYFSTYYANKIKIENRAKERIKYITDILELPMWNIDHEGIKHIGLIYFQDNLVVKLKITDGDGSILFSKEKNNEEALISLTKPIKHKGKVLGNVEIAITSHFYHENNRRLLWTAITTFFIIILLIVITGFFLRMFLKKPMQSLERIADSYMNGSFNPPEEKKSVQEFNHIISTFRKMGEKINHQVGELNNSENKIREYSDRLEQKVKKRTNSLEEKTKKLERSQGAMMYLLEDINESREELEEANNKLKELDKLKSMFIASMSHELRTPLNSIIGFTGVILQGMTGEINERQQDQLSRVYRSSKHLLSLISDVIDISKIEAGRIDVYSEQFELIEIINEAVQSIQPQLKEKNLSLEVTVPDNLQMKTDRKRLFQCLINYLSNSVKFTEQGSIKISAREIGDQVEITVTDTGIGIEKQDLVKLFEAFERLDSHLRVKAGGTGLGLYLTRKLATELLKGTIMVISEPGKGSTFGLCIQKNIATTTME
jgi:signal transduction histidine kinase